ncbi:MAG: helical backbone metal receptor [Brevinematales bacterium]|nr:helical backbone metal receptor [Brevinematales bacterium]
MKNILNQTFIKDGRLLRFIFVISIIFSPVFSIEKRVISLAPNVTEIVYFLGLEKHLIANTVYCNYPEAAKRLPKIGDLWNFDVEKIVEFNPDFVLASFSGNSKTGVERLENLGIKVYTLREETVADILSNISFVGSLFNIQTDEKVKSLSSKISNLKIQNKKNKALFLLSIKPYYSVSTNTFISDVLKIAGFENVIKLKVRYPLLTEEEIIKLKFDFLILPENLKTEEKFIKEKMLDLGKNPQIIFINEDRISRPGPRIFDTIVELSKINSKKN